MNANRLRWIPRNSLRPNSALRLFCMPYAGGSSLTFRDWGQALPREVDVCAVQLPGRGARHFDPLFTRMEPLVRSLGEELLPFLDRPYALFGHSMGALIAFELWRFLRRAAARQPALLLVSGGRAPDVPEGKRDFELSDEDFVAMLRRLDGTPAELLDNPEALQLLLPVLRADFEATQTYVYYDEPPFAGRIKAFGGVRDSATVREVILPWERHTTGSFSLSMLPGGHFFIEESRAELLAIVADELRRVLVQSPSPR